MEKKGFLLVRKQIKSLFCRNLRWQDEEWFRTRDTDVPICGVFFFF